MNAAGCGSGGEFTAETRAKTKIFETQRKGGKEERRKGGKEERRV
jgi:hypothetical protein